MFFTSTQFGNDTEQARNAQVAHWKPKVAAQFSQKALQPDLVRTKDSPKEEQECVRRSLRTVGSP